MALRALPLLYVNMGGEMLYILSQRLKAQRIDADKAQRGTCRFPGGGSTRFGSLSARSVACFPGSAPPNRPQRPATDGQRLHISLVRSLFRSLVAENPATLADAVCRRQLVE
ncbi:hypothetical protein MRX96_002741 [Rhipicephalus microplus]